MTYIVAIPNKKYARLTVSLKVDRAFGQSNQATVRLFNGQKGRLINDMIVVDVLIGDEVMQKVSYCKDLLDTVKSIGINGQVVARRQALGQPLLTTGVGWREYAAYMPHIKWFKNSLILLICKIYCSHCTALSLTVYTKFLSRNL